MLRPYLAALLAPLALASVACEEPPPLVEPPVWFGATEIPGRRLEAAAAAFGTRVAVAGGFSTSLDEGLEITHSVLAYGTFSGEWESLPPLPVAWTHGALASSGGTLYALGGLVGSFFVASGQAFALASGDDEWRPLPSMPAGMERGGAAVVVSPPHIYLIGGAGSSGTALASVLDFNFASSTWSRLPDLPFARSHAAAMRQDNGTLIVAGGLSQLTGEPLGDVYALPLGSDVWFPRAPMPTPRGGCAYGTALGWLVCAGGETASSALRVVEAYDPIADVWHPLPDMPLERAGAPGAVVGQQLYIPGGSGSLRFEPTDSLFVFSLLNALAERDRAQEQAQDQAQP